MTLLVKNVVLYIIAHKAYSPFASTSERNPREDRTIQDAGYGI